MVGGIFCPLYRMDPKTYSQNSPFEFLHSILFPIEAAVILTPSSMLEIILTLHYSLVAVILFAMMKTHTYPILWGRIGPSFSRWNTKCDYNQNIKFLTSIFGSKYIVWIIAQGNVLEIILSPHPEFWPSEWTFPHHVCHDRSKMRILIFGTRFFFQSKHSMVLS